MMIHFEYFRISHSVFTLSILSLLISVTGIRAFATVLDFEDRAYAEVLTGSSYGGLTWETGNPGLLNVQGQWTLPGPAGNYYPHSGTHNLINANGSTLMGIGFSSPVNMNGVYVAVQGAGDLAWAQQVRVHGYLAGQETGVTGWFTPISTTPGWFDLSSLTGVDRIVFGVPPAYYENQAYYGIDDLTFTTIPEPGTLGVFAFASLSLLGVRLRKA